MHRRPGPGCLLLLICQARWVKRLDDLPSSVLSGFGLGVGAVSDGQLY